MLHLFVPVIEFVLLGLDVLFARVTVVHQLPGDLVYHSNTRCLVVHLRLQTLKPAKDTDTLIQRSVKEVKSHKHLCSILSYLCWTTSRSSSFSGISMLFSHCSFSSIQTSQALASLNIL